MSGRRTIERVAAVVGLLGLAALGLLRLEAPESPRLAFRPADGWSIAEGFAEGGRTFLTHGPGGTVVWDAATWRPRSTWPILACRIHAIDRDGRFGLGVRGHDDRSARLVVIDLASGVVRHAFEAGLPAVAHAALPDDRTVRACLADRAGFVREVATWDLAAGTATRIPIGGPGPGPGLAGPQPVAIDPGGTAYASFDFRSGTLQPRDARTDRPLGPALTAAPDPSSRLIAAAAFTPDGRTLVAGRADGRLDVRDVATGRCLRTILAHPGGSSVNTIIVGREGRTALSMGGSIGGAVSALGRLVDRLERSVGMRPAGTAEVTAVDLATGRILARWPGTNRAHLAPDGRTVVTSEPDGSFAVRDLPPLPPLEPASPRGETRDRDVPGPSNR